MSCQFGKFKGLCLSGVLILLRKLFHWGDSFTLFNRRFSMLTFIFSTGCEMRFSVFLWHHPVLCLKLCFQLSWHLGTFSSYATRLTLAGRILATISERGTYVKTLLFVIFILSDFCTNSKSNFLILANLIFLFNLEQLQGLPGVFISNESLRKSQLHSLDRLTFTAQYFFQ